MKRLSRVIGTVVAWLLISAPMLTLAADVTQATYRADIAITNNGTAATNQSTVFTLNSTQLINQNFVNAAFNNTAIINNLGEDTPFSPGSNASFPWVVWVSSIGGAITQVNYNLYTGGNQSMGSKLAYFPGTLGFNVTDNASLEMLTSATSVNITITATFNMSAGNYKYIFGKTSSYDWGTIPFGIFIGMDQVTPRDGVITLWQDTGVKIKAYGVTSGEHVMTFNSTGTSWSIVVDGVTLNTTANRITQTDDGDPYVFAANNATAYMYSAKYSLNGTVKADLRWQYGGTWNTNGIVVTPTYRTATSNANISANMTTFVPLDETTSTYTNPAIGTYNLTGAFTQPGGMYTELTISLPGSDVINDLLDGSSIPRALFWFPILFGIINLFGLGVYALTKNIFVQAICMGVLVMFFSLAGGYGYWVFIEYCIIAIAFILGERQGGF